MSGQAPGFYCCGFAFTKDRRSVFLIEKATPSWQSGLLNGIGGKIEPGETALKAMVREFEEETGLATRRKDWRIFAIGHVTGSVTIAERPRPIKITFFRSFLLDLSDDELQARVTPEGRTFWVSVPALKHYQVVGNLRWLIPLALDPCQTKPIEFWESSLRFHRSANL